FNYWNKLPIDYKFEKLLIKKYVRKLEEEILGQSHIPVEKSRRYNIRKKISRNSWKYVILRRVFNLKNIFNEKIGWSYTFGVQYLFYRTILTDYSSYHSFFTEKTLKFLLEKNDK